MTVFRGDGFAQRSFARGEMPFTLELATNTALMGNFASRSVSCILCVYVRRQTPFHVVGAKQMATYTGFGCRVAKQHSESS